MSGRIFSFTARDWFITGLLCAAEGALFWLAINAALLQTTQGKTRMTALTVAALVVASTVLPRWCHDRGIWAGAFSIVVALGLFISTAAAVKVTAFPETKWLSVDWLEESLASLTRQTSTAVAPVGLIALASAIIWWRCVSRAKPDIDSGLTLMRVGSATLVLLILCHYLIEHGLSENALSASVLIFFIAVLLAIATMRQEMVPWRATERWIETVLFPVVLIIGPAAIIVGLLTQDLAGMVQLLLDPVIWFLALVLRAVAFVLFVLAMIILVPIVWLISLLPVGEREQTEQSPFEITRTTFDNASSHAASAPVLLRYFLALVVVIAIVAIIARFRLRLGYQLGDDETSGDLARVEGSLLDSLRSWLSGLRAGDQRSEIDPLAGLRNDPRWAFTVQIREQYADFLRWSARQNHPRQISTTPDELTRQWSAASVAERDAAIVTLTAIYDRARYGDSPMTAEDARRVERAWQTIKASAHSTGST